MICIIVLVSMSRHLRWVVHFYPISVYYLNVKMSLARHIVTAWTEGGAFARWLQIKRTWALRDSSTELWGRVETPRSEWSVEQEPGDWESWMLASNYCNLGRLSLASIPCQVESLDILD
jgi:(2Fe-2S) ferredoxin